MRLSALVNEIQETLEDRFEGTSFWVNAEITDVKKYADKRWCFIKFIEKEGNTITTEIKGVFWGGTYHHIELFEQQTRQLFANGLQISCRVRVRFHKRYGLTLEVLEIDTSFALGKLAMDREAVLQRLVKENPEHIRLVDGQYITKNNMLPLPVVIQRIALIAAKNSDGERDFLQELKNNRYGYTFEIREYTVQIQGEQASEMMCSQLQQIGRSARSYDVVVIVRGGGSETDFKPFDNYELAKAVATFPIPILTGIGHDRNISITDLMAQASKTPTKAAASIVDHNLNFEQDMLNLKERFFSALNQMLQVNNQQLALIKTAVKQATANYLRNRKTELKAMERLVKNLSPSMLLAKGFAVVVQDEKIISDPQQINVHASIKTILKSTIIHSNVTDKTPYENEPEL